MNPHPPANDCGYDPFAQDICTFKPLNTLCSDIWVEPLAGTARTGDMFVVLEHPQPWSRDILDGGTFNAEETTLLAGLPGLFLIRKPGRQGHVLRQDRTVYLVFCREHVVEELSITTVSDIAAIDTTGPGKNAHLGAQSMTQPLLMICAHAKRDRCCAIKGRPIAKSLVQEFPHAPIWECSHTKGHRFAPSMMLFPWGYFYGRLNVQASIDMYRSACNGQIFLPGNRGRCVWDSKGQVAELAVLSYLAQAGEAVCPSQISVTGETVTLVDGRAFQVELEQEEFTGYIPSCGDEPHNGTVWVARSVATL